MDAHAAQPALRSRAATRAGLLLALLTAVLLLALRPAAAFADAGGVPNEHANWHALAAHAAADDPATAEEGAPAPSDAPAESTPATEPAPTDPAPATEPAPSEPAPTTDPAPSEPAPTDPPTTEPAPSDPPPTTTEEPVDPAPTEPPPTEPPPPADPQPAPEEPVPVEREVVKAPARPAPTRPPADATPQPTPIVVQSTDASAADGTGDRRSRGEGSSPQDLAAALAQLGIHAATAVEHDGSASGAGAPTCGTTVCVNVGAAPGATAALADHESGHDSRGANDPPHVRGPPAPVDGPAGPVAAGAAAAAAAGGQGSAPDCALRADALGLELPGDEAIELPPCADHAAPATANAAARAPPVA